MNEWSLVPVEVKTGLCENCFYAAWHDVDGVMMYGCDMSYCYAAEDME